MMAVPVAERHLPKFRACSQSRSVVQAGPEAEEPVLVAGEAGSSVQAVVATIIPATVTNDLAKMQRVAAARTREQALPVALTAGPPSRHGVHGVAIPRVVVVIGRSSLPL